MSEAKSFRKPYVPEVKANWWTKNPFYTRYMLREGTCLLGLFVSCEILLGIFLFAMCDLSAAEATAESAAPYMWWINSFVGNPIVMILNLVALAACLYHAVTFFNMMPQAVRIFMNKNSTELVPGSFIVIGQYIALGVCTLFILILAFASIP